MGRSDLPPKPISLRNIVERCSGLLTRVAGGRAIEISYGAAASVPVSVPEDVAERILVNLVRNAAAALDECSVLAREVVVSQTADRDLSKSATAGCSAHTCGTLADRAAKATPASIRISVGLLLSRVGDPKPWPFQRVRITVEDSGCGMSVEQVKQLLSGEPPPSRDSHGIGFGVVRQLVAISGGSLRVMSALGKGTSVQVEWPMAPITHPVREPDEFQANMDTRLSC
jgi:signal transduction histidine kinase